jgi:hypothetical protein
VWIKPAKLAETLLGLGNAEGGLVAIGLADDRVDLHLRALVDHHQVERQVVGVGRAASALCPAVARGGKTLVTSQRTRQRQCAHLSTTASCCAAPAAQ